MTGFPPQIEGVVFNLQHHMLHTTHGMNTAQERMNSRNTEKKTSLEFRSEANCH